MDRISPPRRRPRRRLLPVLLLIAAVLVLVVYPLMEEADRRPVVLTYTILAMVVCSGAFVGAWTCLTTRAPSTGRR